MSDPMDENKLLKASFGETGDCLPLEILSILAEDPATPINSKSRQHLETCSHCRNEFGMLREFQVAIVTPEEAASVAWIGSELRRRATEVIAPEPISPWDRIKSGLFPRQRWRTIAAACAALLMATTASIYVGNLAQQDRLSGGEVFRTQKLTAISPVGNVDAAPVELEWRPVEQATRYQVRLLEVDRSEIWSAETQSTPAPIPARHRDRHTTARRRRRLPNQCGQAWSSSRERMRDRPFPSRQRDMRPRAFSRAPV